MIEIMHMTTRIESKDLRAIIIGAGLMGRHHAEVIRRIGSRVVAVVDPDIDRARALAGRVGAVFAGGELATALHQAGPSVAHVCTPVPTHNPLARQLAAAGVHAFIEKPLAASASETRAVLDLFGQGRTLVCPVHQYAFQRSVEMARTRLSAVGQLRRIAFDIRSAGSVNDTDSHDRVAADIIPHPLSILQRLLPGRDIADMPWKLIRAAPGEWLVTAGENGLLLSIGISMGARPTRFATTVSGTAGTFELDNFHDYVFAMPGTVSRLAKATQPFAAGARSLTGATRNIIGRALRGEHAYPGLRTLTARFHAATRCASRQDNPIPARDMIAVATVRDALLAQCRRSAHD